jgi:hypothetical protein
MSSHREAPAISTDPVADSTDLYAFVSPDNPAMVTIIANYIPLEAPAGGPNFFQFGDDVLYEIYIDNDGDALPEITYQFQFQTQIRNPESFLYNTGPITSLTSPTWNRFQLYSVTRVDATGPHVLATNVTMPPCNIGPRSTPNYANLAAMAVHPLPGGGHVFAGQRADGFYVDLGSVFDLADLRPFQNLHLIKTPAAAGVNGLNGFNVHSIAIQIPKTQLTADGSNPTNPALASSVIGVWTSASRRKIEIRDQPSFPPGGYQNQEVGPWVQVSRLGNPLFNEVIVPLGKKDAWNALPPARDSQFQQYVQHPELAKLLPILYPGVFPNLAALVASNTPRADLQAILLTGIPAGALTPAPGFQNYTGPVLADMLRLNMAIPPATHPNIYGLLALDAAGFPNGRRVFDDVTTIELRAVAGAVLPLIAGSTYKADAAASLVSDYILNGTGPGNVPVTAPYLAIFPYLGVPFDGYSVPPFPATPNSAA